MAKSAVSLSGVVTNLNNRESNRINLSQAPPYGKYINAVEQACLKLEPHSVEELRAEMKGALSHSQNPKRNITKEEVQALAEFKKDQSRVILTADKGYP